MTKHYMLTLQLIIPEMDIKESPVSQPSIKHS